jgi:hypothetical protein
MLSRVRLYVCGVQAWACVRFEVLTAVNFIFSFSKWGYAVAQLVKAQRYNPECRGFFSPVGLW